MVSPTQGTVALRTMKLGAGENGLPQFSGVARVCASVRSHCLHEQEPNENVGPRRRKYLNPATTAIILL